LTHNIENDPLWNRIDSVSYLFLSRLFEPRDNSLTVVLEEAVSNKTKSGPIKLPGGVTLEDSCPIEPTSDCLVFTLHWKNYVSYCVTEEMHGSCGQYDDEEYTGRLLRVYSKSQFLDFIGKNTGAHSESYRHYKIACLNHIVDIVATSIPELRALSRQEAGFSEETSKHWHQ
jgi:hypothetical protein